MHIPVEIQDHVLSFLDPWERLRLGLKTKRANLAFKLELMIWSPDNQWIKRTRAGKIVIDWVAATITVSHGERDRVYSYNEFRECMGHNVRTFMGLPLRYRMRHRKKRSVQGYFSTRPVMYVFEMAEDADIFEVLGRTIKLEDHQ